MEAAGGSATLSTDPPAQPAEGASANAATLSGVRTPPDPPLQTKIHRIYSTKSGRASVLFFVFVCFFLGPTSANDELLICRRELAATESARNANSRCLEGRSKLRKTSCYNTRMTSLQTATLTGLEDGCFMPFKGEARPLPFLNPSLLARCEPQTPAFDYHFHVNNACF